MIGLDTNVLIRAATNDDRIRSPKARAIIAALTPEEPAVVNSVGLAEFAWSLRTGYGYTRSEILGAVENRMRSLCYVVPDRGAINEARKPFVGQCLQPRNGVPGIRGVKYG